ncbi:MAG: neutral/alkaline non-lysosomal ceramidase N-terminal domain-containing protein [Blastocatellia bacterium]
MNCALRFLFCILLVAAAVLLEPLHRVESAPADPYKAGFVRAVITPEKPVWMAGYAARTHPSEGKIHDLFAKALALEDARRNRVVLVTTDLLGLPRSMTSALAEHANKSYGLKRAQILFNSSHTHTGPVLSGSLAGAYDLNEEQTAAVAEYTKQLENKLLKLIGEAVRDLKPAKLSYGAGSAGFAMNRRQMTERGMIIGVNREGVRDLDVPVLRVESPDGQLRGVVFGYACHNTTLTGEFYQFSGDYAGFAQEAIEAAHTGATAMFVTGCGADINPHPRSQLELARQHGDELAKSVEQVLKGSMKPVSGTIQSALGVVMIPLAAPPTKDEFQSRLNDPNLHRRRHAQRMLDRYARNGKLLSEYPYTIQIFQIGDLKLIGLAGEVVTDYALRLKRELGGEVWVAGYSNDLCSYIPSARMFKEGGYEVIDSQIYYDMPGPYDPALEEKIIGKAHELVRRVRR